MNVQAVMYQKSQQKPRAASRSTAICLPCPASFQGFSSWQELARLVWECDLSSFSLLEAFQNWKQRDGTKAGLMQLPKRPEYDGR